MPCCAVIAIHSHLCREPLQQVFSVSTDNHPFHSDVFSRKPDPATHWISLSASAERCSVVRYKSSISVISKEHFEQIQKATSHIAHSDQLKTSFAVHGSTTNERYSVMPWRRWKARVSSPARADVKPSACQSTSDTREGQYSKPTRVEVSESVDQLSSSESDQSAP